jgi:hypothetical protein
MQGEPIEPVIALQNQFKLVALSVHEHKNAAFATTALPPLPDVPSEDLAFLRDLAFALKCNE